MADTKSSASGSGAAGSGSLLDQIVQNGKMANEPSQEPYAKKLIGQFAAQILDQDMKFSPDKGMVAMINERIAEIDDLLTKQVNAIMHHPEFQALEGSWRGLHEFVMGSETSSRLKIRLMSVSKKELLNDLETAVDYDVSVLFKKVYEEEYGTFGGNPYSVLIGDYYFGRHPQDVALLERAVAHILAGERRGDHQHLPELLGELLRLRPPEHDALHGRDAGEHDDAASAGGHGHGPAAAQRGHVGGWPAQRPSAPGHPPAGAAEDARRQR